MGTLSLTSAGCMFDSFHVPLTGLMDLHRWNTNNVPSWKGFFSEVVAVPRTFQSGEINIVDVSHS